MTFSLWTPVPSLYECPLPSLLSYSFPSLKPHLHNPFHLPWFQFRIRWGCAHTGGTRKVLVIVWFLTSKEGAFPLSLPVLVLTLADWTPKSDRTQRMSVEKDRVNWSVLSLSKNGYKKHKVLYVRFSVLYFLWLISFCFYTVLRISISIFEEGTLTHPLCAVTFHSPLLQNFGSLVFRYGSAVSKYDFNIPWFP